MTNEALLQMQKVLGMPQIGNIAQPVPMQGYHQSNLSPEPGNNTPMPYQNVPNSEITPAQPFQQQVKCFRIRIWKMLHLCKHLYKECKILSDPQRCNSQNPSASPVNEYMQEIANLRAKNV